MTILCATDLGESGRRALDLAREVAGACGGRVQLLHVADTGDDTETAQLIEQMRPAAEALRSRLKQRVEAMAAELEQERARCERAGIDCEASIEEGRPWEALVDAATRLQPRAVVVGPHHASRSSGRGSRGLADRLLGTTATRVVRHASAPVLVAVDTAWPAPEKLKGARWLVGVDFSAASVRAVREAAAWARPSEGRLVLTHVLPDTGQHTGDDVDSWRELLGQWQHEAEGQLEQLARSEAPDLDVARRVVVGRPDQAILDSVQETEAHLLVVGTHGRRGLARALMGSTAERCLRHSPVPVLVVHQEEDGSS